MIRWGWLYALIILPVECVLLRFCPDIQIFGPNLPRLALAQRLVPFFGEAAYQIAGGIFDIEKMVPYFFAAVLFGVFRALLPSADKESVIAEIRWKDNWQFVVGTLLAVVLLVFFVENFCRPKTSCHVFGPTGKGLLSNGYPGLSSADVIALVLYRAWYLGSFVAFLIALIACLPWYLRTVFAHRIQGVKDVELAALSIRQILPPSVGCFCAAILLIAWYSLRIGALGDVTLIAIWVFLVVCAAWVGLGIVAVLWGRGEVAKAEHPPWDERIAALVIRASRRLRKNPIWAAIGAIGGISTVVSALLYITSIPRTYARELGPPAVDALVLRSETLNSITEFCFWNSAVGREVFADTLKNVAKYSKKYGDALESPYFTNVSSGVPEVNPDLLTELAACRVIATAIVHFAIERFDCDVTRNRDLFRLHVNDLKKGSKIDTCLRRTLPSSVPWAYDADYLKMNRAMVAVHISRMLRDRHLELVTLESPEALRAMVNKVRYLITCHDKERTQLERSRGLSLFMP